LIGASEAGLLGAVQISFDPLYKRGGNASVLVGNVTRENPSLKKRGMGDFLRAVHKASRGLKLQIF